MSAADMASYQFRDLQKTPKRCREQAKSLTEMKKTLTRERSTTFAHSQRIRSSNAPLTAAKKSLAQLPSDKSEKLSATKQLASSAITQKDPVEIAFIPFVRERDHLGRLLTRPESSNIIAEKTAIRKGYSSYNDLAISRYASTIKKRHVDAYSSQKDQKTASLADQNDENTASNFKLSALNLDLEQMEKHQRKSQLHQPTERMLEEFKVQKRTDELSAYATAASLRRRPSVTEANQIIMRKTSSQQMRVLQKLLEDGAPRATNSGQLQERVKPHFYLKEKCLSSIKPPPIGYYNIVDSKNALLQTAARPFISKIDTQRMDKISKESDNRARAITEWQQKKGFNTVDAGAHSNNIAQNTQIENPLKTIKVDRGTYKKISNNDMRWYHSQKKLELKVIPGFTERTLKVEYNNKYVSTKLQIRSIRNKLTEWPEMVMKKHQQFMIDNEESDRIRFQLDGYDVQQKKYNYN